MQSHRMKANYVEYQPERQETRFKRRSRATEVTSCSRELPSLIRAFQSITCWPTTRLVYINMPRGWLDILITSNCSTSQAGCQNPKIIKLPKEILALVAKANPSLLTQVVFSLTCIDFAVAALVAFPTRKYLPREDPPSSSF
jgi:hypothetical protein